MLDPPVDVAHDHVLGPADAELTLVEYGSYACPRCHDVHAVIAKLRTHFGDRMRYVFRHLPSQDQPNAFEASQLAEAVAQRSGNFWQAHQALMEEGPTFTDEALSEIAAKFGFPEEESREAAFVEAQQAVDEDLASARASGARVTPTFFINGQRYRGAWDESSLSDALLGSLGHRIQAAAFTFVRWRPLSGLLLGLATLLALILSNSSAGPAFLALWETNLGIQFGTSAFDLSLLDWINHGLLSIFFFVVGLEIKREFTVGHLAGLRSSALPVIAAFGGITLPALLYAALAPPHLRHGWGIPIGTDTAFAVAVIVLLGKRVPIELRIFLTATVIIDDIVAILVIALFYTDAIVIGYLIASAAVIGFLFLLNKINFYTPLPYALSGIVLWLFLHEAGLHATLAGVVLALLVPTRPPANLRALLAQSAAVIHDEDTHLAEAMRPGPSEAAMRALNTIHGRIESPADKFLRVAEPWSSYLVLPIFALANAGVVWSPGILRDHGTLVMAIVAGLVVGKPAGILAAAWIAVRTGIAVKPEAYSWRQLAGAGALGGIGFTMSLFIAGLAFDDPSDYRGAQVAIFMASLIAAGLGTAILLVRNVNDDEPDE